MAPAERRRESFVGMPLESGARFGLRVCRACLQHVAAKTETKGKSGRAAQAKRFVLFSYLFLYAWYLAAVMPLTPLSLYAWYLGAAVPLTPPRRYAVTSLRRYVAMPLCRYAPMPLCPYAATPVDVATDGYRGAKAPIVGLSIDSPDARFELRSLMMKVKSIGKMIGAEDAAVSTLRDCACYCVGSPSLSNRPRQQLCTSESTRCQKLLTSSRPPRRRSSRGRRRTHLPS